MTRSNPDQIIAHVDLLRAVDRLLVQADSVREKRETLERLLPEPAESRSRSTSGKAEGKR